MSEEQPDRIESVAERIARLRASTHQSGTVATVSSVAKSGDETKGAPSIRERMSAFGNVPATLSIAKSATLPKATTVEPVEQAPKASEAPAKIENATVDAAAAAAETDKAGEPVQHAFVCVLGVLCVACACLARALRARVSLLSACVRAHERVARAHTKSLC